MGLLNFLSVIIIVASNSIFSPNEHFVVNMSDDADVQIAYINNAFSNNFLSFDEGPEKRHFLRKYSAGEPLYHVDIISEFGGSYIESSLFDIWTLLSLQPKGEDGDLSILVDNVFYVKDIKSKMWAVSVKWSVSGWCIDAFSVDTGDKVEKGSFVFIRRS